MRRIFFLVSLVLLAFSLTVRAENTQGFSRKMDPVVLTGAQLSEISGAPIDQIRVFAKHGGNWEPIPFQIDEKTARRRHKAPQYVFTPNVDFNRAFDDDDELVFLSADFGEQAASGEPALGQMKMVEITGIDPASGAAAYAYVMTFEKVPALSPKKYITWNAETRTVEAPGYVVGYPDDDALFFNSLIVPTDRGGSGQNFIDTLKMRGNGRIIVQLFVFDITNQEYINELKGVIQGPVRIIRKIKSDCNAVVFRVHHDVVYAVYYPEWFNMEVPIKMGVRGPTFTYQADARLSLDLNDAGLGMTFINPLNPEGVKVEGTLSEAEKSMNYGPYRWFAMVGQPGKVVVRLDQSPRSRSPQNLYFLDDKTKLDPPEREPGQIGDAGFEILGLNKMPARAKIFKLGFFFPTEWNAKATPDNLMAVIDKPISVKADARAPSAPAAQSSAVGGVPPKKGGQPAARPSYQPPPIATRTRGYLPQLLIDPNLGYGSGFQIVERKTFGTDLSTDFLFLISHRAYQFYRLEEIIKGFGGIDEMRLYVEYILHPNRYFYGVGNDQTPDDLTVFRQERFIGYLRLEKKFLGNFMVAFQMGAMHNAIGKGKLQTDPDTLSIEEKFGPDADIIGGRFGPEVYGLRGGYTNGIRVDFAYDTRDNEIYPRKGTYDILEMEYVPKWLGSDYQYFRYRLDLRMYLGGDEVNPDKKMPRNLWLRMLVGPQVERVFAVRFVAQRMEGERIQFAGREIINVPFYNMSYFGDANSSRGHYWAQWIDNDVTFAMFEMRWHMWKIIDATLFYDIGQVWKDMYDTEEWKMLTFGKMHKSYGVGMRFNMVPAMVMRLDYGFSKENPSGLLYVWGEHTF